MNKKNIAIIFILLVAILIIAVITFSHQQENPVASIDENYCNQYQPDFCPDGCIVCPPCPECSSIQCRLASSCEAMNFNKGWYQSIKSAPEMPIGMANPASVYCREQEGKLEMREDSNGGQYGVCIFSDGSECDEWAFYRGECGQDQQNDCAKRGAYCATECEKEDGVVYLKGCPPDQICCMPKELTRLSSPSCKNLCGDGICQEMVCLAIGCPCAETARNCPQDCK